MENRDERKIKFYHSNMWKNIAKYFRKLKFNICDECGERGDEVHHKKAIDVNKLKDEQYLFEVVLNVDNLQLLCTKCHNSKRSDSIVDTNLMFDDNGDLVKRRTAPPLTSYKTDV